MRIKNVIWDLSGTLFKPQSFGMTAQDIADYSFLFLIWSGKKTRSPLDEHCFTILNQLGKQTGPKDQIIRLHTGEPLPGILCNYLAGTIDSPEALKITMAFLATWAPEHVSPEEQQQVKRMLSTFFNPHSLATCMKPLDLAVTLMERTALKSPLYILSNWDNDSFIPLYNTYKHSVFAPFKKNHIVISAYTGYVKPQKGIYEYLLATHELNPKDCLFIDDQQENVTAAQELDITAWHFQQDQVDTLEEYLNTLSLI